MTMTKAESGTGHMPAYRRRLAEAGIQEVLFQLPEETVALIDNVKRSRSYRSRSQALTEIIEQRRATERQVS